MGHRARGVRWTWNDHKPHRQTDGIGLVLNQTAADSVHGDAVVDLAQASDQRNDFEVWVLVEGVMEGEGAILAPAPEKGGLYSLLHRVGASELTMLAAVCQPRTPTAALSRGGL
jgi:hypothetical protein